jgi:uncharacterized membrane protein YcaP (DUF421 family)
MFTTETVPDILLRILILGPLSLLWVVSIVRFIGLRSFSKMTAFDFIVTLATGSLLANAASASTWTSFIVSSGAMLSLLGAQAIIALLRVRSASWVHTLQNEPLLLMRDGVVNETNMANARVTPDDLYAKLRAANVLKISQVRAVVLETTGDITVLHGPELEEELLQSVRRSPSEAEGS